MKSNGLKGDVSLAALAVIAAVILVLIVGLWLAPQMADLRGEVRRQSQQIEQLQQQREAIQGPCLTVLGFKLCLSWQP